MRERREDDGKEPLSFGLSASIEELDSNDERVWFLLDYNFYFNNLWNSMMMSLANRSWNFHIVDRIAIRFEKNSVDSNHHQISCIFTNYDQLRIIALNHVWILPVLPILLSFLEISSLTLQTEWFNYKERTFELQTYWSTFASLNTGYNDTQQIENECGKKLHLVIFVV